MKKRILLTISIIIAIPIVAFVILLLVLTITDYRPEAKVPIKVSNNQTKNISKNAIFSISTFNIGYCGMDKDVDFFMDGGKGSRSISKSKTLENLKGIGNFFTNEQSDINIIQEIDVNSTRSYHVNELNYFNSHFKSYSSSFAYNYKVLWVPLPLFHPMGDVNSGILTQSRFSISSATRYDYPGKESWPHQLADLDRCFVETRMPVQGGKELVLINSHLSAFDKGGKIRKQQLKFLQKHIISEYNMGNYIIVGGDWNSSLPGTDPSKFMTTQSWPDWLQRVAGDFKPTEFTWAVDPSVPTNRTDNIPYKKNVNFLSIIDGFLVSPNVEIKQVIGHSLDFRFTDHNPVTAYFELK